VPSGIRIRVTRSTTFSAKKKALHSQSLLRSAPPPLRPPADVRSAAAASAECTCAASTARKLGWEGESGSENGEGEREGEVDRRMKRDEREGSRTGLGF